MCKPTTNGARGFTLVELLVTVGIIGILATVMVQYRPQDRRNQQFNAFVRGGMDVVTSARAFALANSQKAFITVQNNVVMAFVDNNNNFTYDAGETVIASYPSGTQQAPPAEMSASLSVIARYLGLPTTLFFDGEGMLSFQRSTAAYFLPVSDGQLNFVDTLTNAKQQVFIGRYGWIGIVPYGTTAY